MENALAATCVASGIGVSMQVCAEALEQYEGIYRRHQVYGKKNGVWLIDDYAQPGEMCSGYSGLSAGSIKSDCLVSAAWIQAY